MKRLVLPLAAMLALAAPAFAEDSMKRVALPNGFEVNSASSYCDLNMDECVLYETAVTATQLEDSRYSLAELDKRNDRMVIDGDTIIPEMTLVNLHADLIVTVASLE